MDFTRHIVADGERLWNIAEDYLRSQNRDMSPKAVRGFVDEIVKNSPDVSHPDKIYPNQTLNLTVFNRVSIPQPAKSTFSSAKRFVLRASSTTTGISTGSKAKVSQAGGSSHESKLDFLYRLRGSTYPESELYPEFNELLNKAVQEKIISIDDAHALIKEWLGNTLEQGLEPGSRFYDDFDYLVDESLKKGFISNRAIADSIREMRRDRTKEILEKANNPANKLYPKFKEMCKQAVDQGVITPEEAYDFRLDRVANTIEYASYPENDFYKDFDEIVGYYIDEGFLTEDIAHEAFQMRITHTRASLNKATDPKYKLYNQFDKMLKRALAAGVIDTIQVNEYKKLRVKSTNTFIQELPEKLRKAADQEDYEAIQRLYTSVTRTGKKLGGTELEKASRGSSKKALEATILEKAFRSSSKKALEATMLQDIDAVLNHAAQAMLNGHIERGSWIINTLYVHGKIDDQTRDQFLKNTKTATPLEIKEGPEIVIGRF